jgi:hypothetical protein
VRIIHNLFPANSKRVRSLLKQIFLEKRQSFAAFFRRGSGGISSIPTSAFSFTFCLWGISNMNLSEALISEDRGFPHAGNRVEIFTPGNSVHKALRSCWSLF